MLFHPEKLKYKKYFRRKLKKKTYTYKNSKLFYKGYGFMVLETGYINEKQFKALYWYLRRRKKKLGSFSLNFLPNFPYTKKPKEVRMGKGKGSVDNWKILVKKGRLIISIWDTKDFHFMEYRGIKAIKSKIPLKLKLIKNI